MTVFQLIQLLGIQTLLEKVFGGFRWRVVSKFEFCWTIDVITFF